jgi:hypothetical protein
MGMPLLDLDGKVLGHLAVLDLRPDASRAARLKLYFKSSPPERQLNCAVCAPKHRCASANRSLAAWLAAPWTRSSSSIGI